MAVYLFFAGGAMRLSLHLELERLSQDCMMFPDKGVHLLTQTPNSTYLGNNNIQLFDYGWEWGNLIRILKSKWSGRDFHKYKFKWMLYEIQFTWKGREKNIHIGHRHTQGRLHKRLYLWGELGGCLCLQSFHCTWTWNLLNSEPWDCIYSCKIDQIVYVCIYSFIFKNNVAEDMLNLDSWQFDKLTHFFNYSKVYKTIYLSV